MATAKGAWGEDVEVEDTIVETPPSETPETSEQVISEVTPTEVPETVETPAAEVTTEVQPEAVIETPAETPTQTEVIREVEKIVEKYPEMDEYTGQLFQALMEGKEDVLLDYLSEKHRNYATMSDYDVVKADLKKSKPTWTDEQLDLKIESKYGEIASIDLDSIDEVLSPLEYAEAVAHNKLVEKNQKILKLDAIEARETLEAGKKEIKLPKIELPIVEPVNEPTPEELAQVRADWEKLVDNEIPNLKEFTFKVGDKDNGYEDVAYTISDSERAEQKEFLKGVNMDKMVARLGWIDENGKQNIQKMAGDVLKLEKMQVMLSSAYTQGKTTGTKSAVEEIKNIDLNTTAQPSVATTPPDIGLTAWGHINPK